MKRDRIFISYSHKDKVWLEELQTHLKPFVRADGIVTWDDRTLKAGDLWQEEIDNALQAASVAVLLVSPNFLASDFIMNVELPMLLKAAASGELKVCWLLVGACAVETTELPKFQAAHDLLHPLDTLKKSQRNQVLTDIARTVSHLYQSTKEIEPTSSLKGHSNLAKMSARDDTSNVDSVMKFISGLLKETTLFSAEKILFDKTEFFVDRDSEQLSIYRAFESCVEKKRTETVFIRGDFGTGKTALISNFLLEVSGNQPQTSLVGYTQCQKEKELEGCLPFITLFKLLIGKTIKDKILSKRPLTQYLLDFCPAWLKLAEPELGSLFANSNFSQDAIQIQFCKFLSKVGYNHNLVLVIDDLQWADKSSLGLLSYLASETINSSMLILTAFRPEGLEKGLNAAELRKTRRKLLIAKNVTEIDVPFGINVEAYIQKRYHHNIFPKELVKKIELLSDGQALYLDQFFSHLEQKNFIVYEQQGSQWMLANSIGAPSVPGSIEEVLDARLEEMKEDYREILKMASVEGEEFTVQIVSRLVRREEEDLITQLPRLSAESRLIAEEGPQDIDLLTFDFYKFTHRFFREHIYNRLGKDQRRRFHRDVASYLEDLTPNKRSIAGILAYHCLEAHEYEKGMLYAKLAAEQAREIGKWHEAIDWSKEVLKLVEKLKQDTKNHFYHIEEAIDAILVWGGVAEYIAEFGNLLTKIDEFIPQVKDIEQYQPLYARLLMVYAKICTYKSLKDGSKAANKAIEIFHKAGDVQNELETKYHLAYILLEDENDIRGGIKVFRELAQQAEQYQPIDTVADIYASLAWALLYIGNYKEAFSLSSKAYDSLVGLPNKNLNAFGFVVRVLSQVSFELGQYEKAVKYQLQAIDIYRQESNLLSEYWTRFELGTSYIEQGKTEDGISEYNACLEFAKRTDNIEFQAWIRAEFATLKMLDGDLQTAEKELVAVDKLLSEDGTYYDRLDYLIRLAQLRIVKRSINDIETLTLIQDAEQLIVKYGFEIELVKVNYLYSQVHLEKGEYDRAINYLNQNIELCQRLEAMVQLCDSYEHLGDLYKKQADYRLSAYNYQLAISIRKKLVHHHQVESILSKLKAVSDMN